MRIEALENNGASYGYLKQQAANVEASLLAAAAQTATFQTADQVLDQGRGVKLFLDISAVAGAGPAPGREGQETGPGAGPYVDIPGAAFAQKNSTGTDSLTIYPGVGAVANRLVSAVPGRTFRLV